MKNEITFEHLAESIKQVHETTSSYAKGAINQLLTVRNWAIVYYIVEFEQKGKERAEYGNKLLENLANSLNCKGLDRTMLTLCRVFYLKYPQICDSVNHRLAGIGLTRCPLRLKGEKGYRAKNGKIPHRTRCTAEHLRFLLQI